MIELMGQAEITAELRTNSATLHYWRHSRGFPAPIAELQMGRVWLGQEVREWAAENDHHYKRTRKAKGAG